MEGLRAGVILIMVVTSLLLRLNGFILIRTKRNEVPLFPSVMLNILSPLLCLITLSYATGRSRSKDMRSPVKGTIVLILALLASQYISGMIFVGGLFILGLPIPTGRALGPGSDGISFQAEHILAVVALSSIFLFLILLILRADKDPVSYLKGRKVLINSIFSLLALVPVLVVTYFLSFLINELGLGNAPELVEGLDSTWDILLLGIAIVIVAPFIEELLFRGYLFDQIRKRAGSVLTIVVTSLLFALVHFSLVTILPVFFMGLIMGVLRENSGSILPSFLFHSANNLLALIVLAYY